MPLQSDRHDEEIWDNLRWHIAKGRRSTIVDVLLSNHTNGNLNLYDKKVDRTFGRIPNVLIRTSHLLLVSRDGSKGFVKYEGTNKNGTQCAWLLAWHTATGIKKVYAECGEKSCIEAIDWQAKVDNSTSSLDYDDETTSTKVYATIGEGAIAAAFFG